MADLALLPESDHASLLAIIEQTSLINNDANTGAALRNLKALFSYRWAKARIGRTLSNTLLGELQTAFAEASIDKALKSAWADPQFNKIVPQAKRYIDGTVPGLFILGLGKLGGYDLNFSSDVDLIAFYDSNQLPVASAHGRTDICNRVLKKLSQILGKSIDGEFIWRVDWRLRPNASSLSLTLSTEAAEDFYYFHSLPWHRLAMTKARVIAGDINCGDKFIADLDPYIWRQNLDYQMVDEIFRLKSKINLEHPQLKQARKSGALYDIECGQGFNLKLGRGGIREIEFITNAIQLLWGGKKPLLRTKSTRQTLENIFQANLLDEKNKNLLSKAYRFLRWFEDALQILENAQVHTLPEKTNTLQKLLLLTDYTEDKLWQELSSHRKNVIAIFDDLFAKETNPLDENNDTSEPDWVENLPPLQREIWDSWAGGFGIYAVNPAQSSSLNQLFIKLTKLLNVKGIDRISAISRLHTFFRSIPKGAQYLRLLAEQPNLLTHIARPLLHSPHMANLLEQSPHIVDMLLEPSLNNNPFIESTSVNFSDESDFVLHTKEFGLRLERLRRFVNEQLYLSCLFLMQGKINAIELSRRLTALAEHTIQLGLEITNDEMGLTTAPISIIGMGKFGMSAMAPMSDLDLIFVANTGVELEFANQYSNRFQHLMEVRTREGRAYEMDMRLRPSGRSGPATVSLMSFEQYHYNNAKTWEHIALTAGRAIAGPTELTDAITEIRSNIMSKNRNERQFKLDAAKMLWRLQAQRIGQSKEDELDVKLRRGGLMETDYLSACTCLLAHLEADSAILPYDQMMAIVFNQTHRFSYLKDKQASSIIEATQFWRKLQIWSRVFGLNSINFDNIQPDITNHLLKDMQVDSLLALKQQVIKTSLSISEIIDGMQAEFTGAYHESWENWVEAPVEWG